MFDIGWSELLVIAVVLVVVVGPKDLPAMLRTFGRTTKQLRTMAGDFRRQFDEALREAELDDVKSTVDEMRKYDPRREIRAAMNPMKAIGDEIRSSLTAATRSDPPRVPSSEATLSTGEPDKGAVGEATPSWLSQDAMKDRVSDPADLRERQEPRPSSENYGSTDGRLDGATRVRFSPARSRWSSARPARSDGARVERISGEVNSGEDA